MKYWEEKQISVGTIPENSKVKAIFEGTDELPTIQEIKVGCRTCTDYKFNKKTKQLTVTLSLGTIPKHLSGQKQQGFRKVVTVRYDNGKEDLLSLIGIKEKR